MTCFIQLFVWIKQDIFRSDNITEVCKYILLFYLQKNQKSSEDLPNNQDEACPTSSPSLLRKKAMRNKVLRSGAYRSFTFTPVKQRSVQEQLSVSQGGPSVHSALSRIRELIR